MRECFNNMFAFSPVTLTLFPGVRRERRCDVFFSVSSKSFAFFFFSLQRKNKWFSHTSFARPRQIVKIRRFIFCHIFHHISLRRVPAIIFVWSGRARREGEKKKWSDFGFEKNVLEFINFWQLVIFISEILRFFWRRVMKKRFNGFMDAEGYWGAIDEEKKEVELKLRNETSSWHFVNFPNVFLILSLHLPDYIFPKNPKIIHTQTSKQQFVHVVQIYRQSNSFLLISNWKEIYAALNFFPPTHNSQRVKCFSQENFNWIRSQRGVDYKWLLVSSSSKEPKIDDFFFPGPLLSINIHWAHAKLPNYNKRQNT